MSLPTLKELEEMAWTMPFKEVERRFGITGIDTSGCKSPYYQP